MQQLILKTTRLHEKLTNPEDLLPPQTVRISGSLELLYMNDCK